MEKLSAANKGAIKHYVKTGKYDPNDRNWPGKKFTEALTNADNVMQEGLIAAVLKKAHALHSCRHHPAATWWH